MKRMNFRIVAIAVLSLMIISCADDESYSYDCEYKENKLGKEGLVDDTELAFIKECNENAFKSKEEIENNLIGEWELIGFGSGWQESASQPCIYIKFAENEMLIDITNADGNKVINNSWFIDEIVTTAEQPVFRLNTSPDFIHEAIITRFSEKFMYSDSSARDGNMYLYEKMN